MLSQDEFLALQNVILDTLSKYIKTIKTDGSWIQYYVERLAVKPPVFVFNEPKDIFMGKLTMYYDIVDLAFLYCKITNPKDYIEDNHMIAKMQKRDVLDKFKDIEDEQWVQMRGHLRSYVIFGAS